MRRSFTQFYTLFLFLTLSSFSIVYSQCGPLTTPFNHNNGQDGIMFDLAAINPVNVTGIEMDFDPGTYTVEIYSRPGTHVGFENSAVGWNLEGSATVTSTAANQATNIPIAISLDICPGQSVGLYVTCTNGNTNYTNGTAVGNVWAADANLQILEGTGKQYPFDLSFTPRAFNGTVHYDCVPPSCPAANAGPDQVISCGATTATMAASTCGQWSVVSGSGTFSDINDPNATVSGLAPGANVFEWSTSCPTTTDQVTITTGSGPDVDPLADQTVCDSYTLPAITGTNLTGNEAYFTATGGGGTQYNAGQNITTTTTLFIYDETGGTPNCFDEETFTVTVNTSPDVDPIADINGCGSVTLPAITGTNLTGNEAYYTGTGGTGTQYAAGSNFSTVGTTTLYIYDETGTTPNCFDEESFTVTLNAGPVVDPLANQTVCDSYTLPAITGTNLTGNEAYFTATGGGGTQYNAGDVISTVGTQTLYIYDETGTTPNCTSEETFDLTINLSPDIDPIANMNGCGSITFPAITGTNLTGNEAYYTGPGGTGTQYAAGSNFTTTGTTTIYIYDETGTTPNCFDEESFDVTITAGPTVDDLPDQTVCDSYTLPAITGTNLTGNEAYYTATGGGGTQYNAGDMIATSGTTTLYIYDAAGPGCTSEEMVDITVNISPDVDPLTDQTVCDSYTLPAITGTNLTGNEAYFTATAGGGTQYNAGDMITTSGTTTLYIYDAAGTCTDEETFDVTVNITPDVDPQNNVTVCGSYTFAAITGTNLSGNEAYYTGPGGTGTQYNPGDNLTTAGANTIYIYDASGTCTDEESFTVTIGTTLAITITYTDPTTCGGTDGSITISGVLPNTAYNVEYTENGTAVGPNSITSNGAGELIINGLGAGDYSDFVVEYAGCTGTDNTVYTLVDPTAPTVNITGNEIVCEGETVTLATDLTGAHTWSDNSTGNTLDVTTAGTYWVDVDDGTGCIASDTVEVEFSDEIILDITPIAESCIDAEDGTVEVEVVQGQEPFTYSWLNGSTEETPTFAPGIYTVTVTNDYGCSYSDTVDIEAATEECTDPSIYIPNIFSPNGDGVNDVFEVYGTDITQLSVQIFDRWGKLVFYSTDVEAAWDGTRNGKPMNTAVFAYLIRVTFAGNYQEEYKGNVTLVRKK